ncbi:MAG: hypothetical protein HY824_10135 [Acidobacteria bacterium]|nr:hypothetical protein [Acidobacteriota bacterium]
MSLLARLLRRAGLALHPLVNPHEDWLRDRLETILAEQRRDLTTLLKDAERQQKQLHSVDRELEQLRDKSTTDLASVRRTLAAQHVRLRRQLGFSERVLRRAAEGTPAYREEKVLDRLEKLSRTDQPILVGPWTGEVGFELIYWIPFVRWAAAHYGLDPSRLIVCSRGGPASWYQGLAGGYADVFDVATEEEFRRHTIETPKQRTLRRFDRDIVRRVRKDRAVSLLHPALMYHLFMPFWKQQAPMSQVLKYSQFKRLQPFDLPGVTDRLPSRYVAVRFYFSQCFPDTPDNRAFVTRTLLRLAGEVDVVLLHPGLRIDDHADVVIPASPRIHAFDALQGPSRNLEAQTAVIARAAGFVGTYGGYSYLAPFFGVPSLAFYSERNFYLHHLHMAGHALDEIGGGTLTPIHTRDEALLRAVAG